jgi:glycosyltransferase involved in cell wall biosynthesis
MSVESCTHSLFGYLHPDRPSTRERSWLRSTQRSARKAPDTFGAVPRATKPHDVLVVGQTPPPFGGQAVMIEQFLNGHYARLRLHHVRLAFSDDMESVGKFAVKKVWVLFTTIVRIWVARFRTGSRMLYYPPSGPKKVPVLRDLVLLGSTRWLFRYVVFHFHAGGVSGFAPSLPAPLRPLFRFVYRKPSLAIRTAPQNPNDGHALGARMDVIVPNGVPDMRGQVEERSAGKGERFIILFTAVLIPSKGVLVLLEAFAMLVRQGIDGRLQLMGTWGDAGFEQECMRFIATNRLHDRVEILGVKRDLEKFDYFAACDVFCFPSYFEAESFGLVLLEAMQFAKPVVSSHWRGIPSVVQEGVNGFLTAVQDPAAVADRLLRLARDPSLRQRMGEEGRRIFAERFTVQRFQQNMEDALVRVFEHSKH